MKWHPINADCQNVLKVSPQLVEYVLKSTRYSFISKQTVLWPTLYIHWSLSMAYRWHVNKWTSYTRPMIRHMRPVLQPWGHVFYSVHWLVCCMWVCKNTCAVSIYRHLRLIIIPRNPYLVYHASYFLSFWVKGLWLFSTFSSNPYY